MRGRIAGGLAALLTLAASDAGAQAPLNPDTPSPLTWTAAQQAAWYPHMETVYRVNTIPAGGKVRALPPAGRTIDPTFTSGGKTLSIADYMAANRVSGVLVLKDGRILMERYGMGRRPQDRWTSFSVAKSMTSTLVGAAIADGKIRSLEDPVTTYIPEMKGSAYDAVTVRQLLTMSSGVKWSEDYGDPNSDVARAGREILDPGVNPLVSYMRRLPRAEPAGSKFVYKTGETDLAGVLVSRATGKTLSAYASEKIWRPFGMEQDAIWVVDLAGHERGGCCMSMTLRDYARFGLFMLEGGKAGGRQVVPADWVGQATAPQVRNGAPAEGYGFFWWLQPGGYAAMGVFGQSITVFPKDRVVIAINSAWPEADADRLWAEQGAFVEALRAAAAGR